MTQAHTSTPDGVLVNAEMSRRRFVGGGLSILGLAAAAGRSGVQAGLTPAAGTNENALDFFWYVEGDRARYTIDAARRFEERNHGIVINTRHTAYAPYWDKLATETAGGNPPDVFQIELARQAEYAARGSVAALTDLIPDLIERIEPEVLESCTFDDEVHFIPTGLSTAPALVFNDSLLREVGVSTPPDSWLQRDYTAFCHEVRDASGGTAYGTSDLGGSHWALQAFARTRGDDPFTRDGRLGFSEETIAEWLAWWQELRETEACVPMTRSAEGGGFENFPVITREAAVSSTASAKGMLGLQGLTDDELGLLPFPLADTRAS